MARWGGGGGAGETHTQQKRNHDEKHDSEPSSVSVGVQNGRASCHLLPEPANLRLGDQEHSRLLRNLTSKSSHLLSETAASLSQMSSVSPLPISDAIPSAFQSSE